MPPTHCEPARQIPVAGEYDVIVAGGGTAGVVAGIAAARKGAKTLIVEQFGFLGGTQSGALVGPLAPNYLANGRPLTEGIGQEIWDRLATMGFSEARKDGCYDPAGDWPWFDTEMLKYLLDDMVREAGAEVLFHTFISDVILDGTALRGLIVENKTGRQALLAKVVVDATGDADVAFRAGVPCESGRKSDGLNQAVSLRFHLGNVDWERASAFLRENGLANVGLPTVSYAEGGGGKDIAHIIRKAIEDGVCDAKTLRYFQFFAVPNRPGEISFNCPELRNLSPVDAADLSRIQMDGRVMIRKLMHFCRQCLPGFENCYLVCTAPLVGIRTSRRIVGEHVLTEQEVLECTKFPDAVARDNWPPDIHAPKEGEKLEFTPHLPVGEYCEIPYGCIVPKQIDNLLVAGRCISTTFEALAAIRIARCCQALGQSAGTAAALCTRSNTRPRNLDGKALCRVLQEDGLWA